MNYLSCKSQVLSQERRSLLRRVLDADHSSM